MGQHFSHKMISSEEIPCPGRRTKRRKSQKLHVQKSEISKNALSENVGPLCAEQALELSKMHFQKLWDSCAQIKTSEISKNALSFLWDSSAQTKTSDISKIALSGILGLLCAEHHLRNIKECTFRNSGIPVRRTKHRTSQNMHFQEFWDSCAQHEDLDFFSH